MPVKSSFISISLSFLIPCSFSKVPQEKKASRRGLSPEKPHVHCSDGQIPRRRISRALQLTLEHKTFANLPQRGQRRALRSQWASDVWTPPRVINSLFATSCSVKNRLLREIDSEILPFLTPRLSWLSSTSHSHPASHRVTCVLPIFSIMLELCCFKWFKAPKFLWLN